MIWESEEEPTKPDQAILQQWRRLVSAFESVPPESKEDFLSLVSRIARSYHVVHD